MKPETPEKKCILIVDDSPINIDVLSGVLSHDYQFKVALNGEKALQICEMEKLPDMILLDVMMPKMDGYEVCRHLKANENTRDIPVIFITSKDEEEDETKGFNIGAVDYITKPISPAIVKARIKTHLALLDQKQQIKENYLKLQELETLRDNLFHMIVHDLRSPLTSIQGYLQLYISLYADTIDEKGKSYLEASSTSCDKIVEMVSSLLDVSKMENKKMSLNLTEYDISKLGCEVLNSFQATIEKRQINVVTPKGSHTITIDVDLIRRVFTNLISNALRFVFEGGELSVSIAEDDNMIKVSIFNSGICIPEEYHSRIFDKFGQVGGDKQSRKVSTGLGLTFCKLAVETHQGEIGVESEEGKGNTFWFKIPNSLSTV